MNNIIKEQEWEKEFWLWATDNFPFVHSDKFEGVIELFRSNRSQLLQEIEERVKKLNKEHPEGNPDNYNDAETAIAWRTGGINDTVEQFLTIITSLKN